jgi:acyl-CoA thioester hydrolase
MRPDPIPLERLESLPLVYRAVAPEDYRDLNDHMNVRGYLALYDDAGIPLFALLGLDEAYFRAGQATTFDLEHHIHYLSEVHIGDALAFRARLVGRSPKRLHYLLFMVNETRGALASILEVMNTHVDRSTRRTAPYPEAIAARMDAMLAAHARLDWPAPVCGAMRA